MSKIYNFTDTMLILSNYKQPQKHTHLASHIMVSLGDEIEYIVEEEVVKGRGVCIKSNVAHTGSVDKSGMLMFLFTEPCRYTKSIDEVYLKGKNYCVIDDETVENMLEVYRKYEKFDKLNGQELVDNMLCVCGLNPWDEERYDERIRKVFSYISNLNTIEHDIMSELSSLVHLSKTRLSHLFKQNTGVTLHSYIAYEKLHKTYLYKISGMSLTDACILAGFNSSSHCAYTCKKMYGFSLSEIYKNLYEGSK